MSIDQMAHAHAEDHEGSHEEGLEATVNKFDTASSKIKDSLNHARRVQERVDTAFYNVVNQYDLGSKDYQFTAEQREELIDGVLESLKGLLIDTGRVRDPESLDPDGWDTMFQNYFGLDRQSLQDQWKDTYVIDRQQVDAIIDTARGQLTQQLTSNALKDLKHDDVQGGAEYLRREAGKIGYDVDPKAIRDVNDLRRTFAEFHQYAHQLEQRNKARKAPQPANDNYAQDH